MKCPICGNKLEIKNKQIGTDNSGDPVFNEYAVCRDCKKQWNLDRQRARKIAAKKEAEQAEAKPVDKAESKVAVIFFQYDSFSQHSDGGDIIFHADSCFCCQIER